MKVISTRRAGVFDESDTYSEGWEQVVTYTDAEMAELLAAYDPASSTSPAVAVTRPVVRELLDAVQARITAETPQ